MEGQAVYSATPLRSNPSDRFIGNEVFDYDSIELSDNDIYSQEFAIVNDSFQGSNPNPRQTQFRFIYQDLESWIDLAGSFVRCRFHVSSASQNQPGTFVDTVGTTIPDARSLWEQVIFSLGGDQIENHSKDYWAYAQMSNKMYSYKFTNTVGTMMGLYETRNGQPGLELNTAVGFDTENSPGMHYVALSNGGGGHFNYDDTACYNFAGNGIGQLNQLENKSERGAPTEDFTGANFEVWIPLATMLGFCQAYPRVIKGLKVELDLYKSRDAISTYTPAATNNTWDRLTPPQVPQDHRVNVLWDRQGVQLFVRRIRANEGIERSLSTRLVNGINYRVNFEDWYMDRFNFKKEDLKVEHRIVNVGSLPTKVWISFQDTRCQTRSDLASWQFLSPNLTDIQLYCNGQLVPQNIIKINMGDPNQPVPQTGLLFQDDDHSIPYQMYLQQCGMVQNSSPYMRNFRGGSGNMTYNEWRNTHPIFCWDLGNVAITPFFEGRAELVVRFTKFLSNTGGGNPQDPPEPDNYTMFSCVHCLKGVELSFKDHKSYVTMNTVQPAPP